jgi:Mn2+/Fe2+ NRAMP family transporter
MPKKSDMEALGQLVLLVIAGLAILGAGVLGTQVTQEIINGISNLVLAVIITIIICGLVFLYYLKNRGNNPYA